MPFLFHRVCRLDCWHALYVQGVRLANMLGVPGVIKTDCGFVVDEMCAFDILLYRLAYPCTLKHVRIVFGLSSSRIRETYQVYGDPAYGLSQYPCTPYKSTSAAARTLQMCEFNQRMSACRVSVEWAFGEVSRLRAFCNYKPQQKSLLSPVATQHTVSPYSSLISIHA